MSVENHSLAGSVPSLGFEESCRIRLEFLSTSFDAYAMRHLCPDSFLNDLVKPLLRHWGLQYIREIACPGGRGVDLLCCREDFGQARLYYVRVFSRSVPATAAAFDLLLRRLVPLLHEPVLDPTTGVSRRADACLLITACQIPGRFRAPLFESLSRPEFRGIHLVDASILLGELERIVRRHFTPANYSSGRDHRVSQSIGRTPDPNAVSEGKPALRKVGRDVTSPVSDGPSFAAHPVRPLSPSLSRWEERQIQPISLDRVAAVVSGQYSDLLMSVDSYKHRAILNRGKIELLQKHNGYGELPDFDGVPALERVCALPSGSILLDVGCGFGQLGSDILKGNRDVFGHVIDRPLNPGIKVYGFDAIPWREQQYNLTGVAVGNVDRLAKICRAEFGAGFVADVITSSALMYHLPDPWHVILQITELLKDGGVFLVSSLPRVVVGGKVSTICGEDECGSAVLRKAEKLHYFRDVGTIFDTSGNVVSVADAVRIINDDSRSGFRLSWSKCSDAGDVIYGNGAQMGGARTRKGGKLRLNRLFYCRSDRGLGYVIARTRKEEGFLRRRKFESVQERLGPEQIGRAA